MKQLIIRTHTHTQNYMKTLPFEILPRMRHFWPWDPHLKGPKLFNFRILTWAPTLQYFHPKLPWPGCWQVVYFGHIIMILSHNA